MSGYYNPHDSHHLPHHHPPPPLPDLPEDATVLPAHFFAPNAVLMDDQRLQTANLSTWYEQEGDMSATEPKGSIRIRRRAPPGSDHVKHRRTRSGCYTCRSRRVKCDETHPVCERCKKGSRDCVYPEPASATKSSSGSKLGQPRRQSHDTGSSSDDYEDIDEASPISPTQESKIQRTRTSIPNLKSASRKQSKTSLTQPRSASVSDQAKEKSLSPSTDESHISILTHSGKLSSISTNTSQGDISWAHLPRDQAYYLSYHHQHLTHFHYFFKCDPTHFVRDTIIEIALSYEPLLYAVVGFAAFHHTVAKPNGKISDFLGYYNKSVSLLRKSLQSTQPHSEATIITILQLAAFEEYLGDWVNLMGHQKAACEMIRELYTPETIVQTEMRRKMLAWYIRFDLFAGLMAGNETVLGIEWFQAYERCYASLSMNDPTNQNLRIETCFAEHRTAAVEMALLFAKLPKGEISVTDFMRENALLGERIRRLRLNIEPFAQHSHHTIKYFEGCPKLDPDDIVNPYELGKLFGPPLFSVNFLLLDWFALDTMFKYQSALMLQQSPPAEMEALALEQCQIFEAIEFWSGSPAGSILPAQASLGLTCLFLPRDEKHTMWCRRKLAKVESLGYIYPPSFRTNMAENWSMPSIHQWWLPDDIGYPPIIRAIRAFIEERTTRPRNQEGEDVRSMKAMFSKLNFDDSPKSTPESSSSIAESGASFSTSNFGTGQPWNDSVPTSTTGDMGYDSMMNSPTQMQAHPAGMGMLTGSDSINVDSSAMSLDPSMMHDLAAWGMSDVNKPDQPGYHPQGP